MKLICLPQLLPTVALANFEPIPCPNHLLEIERVRTGAGDLEGQLQVRQILDRVQIELEPRGFKYDEEFITNVAMAINFDPAALELFNAFGVYVGAILELEPSRRVSAYHESEELLNLTLKLVHDTPLKQPIDLSWRGLMRDFAHVLRQPELVKKANARIDADGIAGSHHIRLIRNSVAR